MEKDTITIKEALEITVKLLETVSLPVAQYDEITKVNQAIKNINNCINAIPDVKPEEVTFNFDEAEEVKDDQNGEENCTE